ncbi:hypothetical protein QR680_013138 [Steinernema hermaphroditum]|uniref:histone acetyltransferase n=1 Tax=Steinernema hermaphroditum TaxID=289476 RepID=A0AA39I4H8_9BILA|nr:hypothetical protein QR680_013138 [Steinernema hermaphroditum]
MGRKFDLCPHHLRTEGIPDDRLRVGQDAELIHIEQAVPVTPLSSLLHARRCLLNTRNNRCSSPRCSAAKTVLSHMENCREHACTFPRCHSSRRLLAHWENCYSHGCVLCVPLRRIFSRSPPSSSHMGSQMVHQWMSASSPGLAI